MELATWLMAGLAFVLGAGAAALAARWWFGRQLLAAAVQQDRLEKARQFTAQQASQARRQIEVLQQDIAVLRLAAVKRGGRQVSTPAAPAADGTAGPGRPELSADGFAETQVLLPKRR